MPRLAALLLLFCTGFAWADASSHRALAEELIQLTRADDSVQAWRKRFDTQAQDVVRETLDGRAENTLSAAQQQALAQFNQSASAALDEVLATDKVHEPLVRLYMQTFSEEEATEIAAFLKTEAGQKMLHSLPVLDEGVAGVVRTQVEGIRPHLNAIEQAFVAELMPAAQGIVRTVQVTPPTPPAEVAAEVVPATLTRVSDSKPAAQGKTVKRSSKARTKTKTTVKRKTPVTAVRQSKARTVRKSSAARRCKDPKRTYPHCSK